MANVIRPFRFWVQKALPLVYDDSLSYYELLCKVINYLNNVVTDVNALAADVDTANAVVETANDTISAFITTAQGQINNSITEYEGNVNDAITELTTYRDNYFENLDVQDEINNKLDAMVLAGTMQTIVANIIGENSSPVIVDSITDMTDSNKIYVLSINNVMYQWSDSEQGFVATNAYYGGNSTAPSVVEYTFGFDTTSDLDIFNIGSVFVIIDIGASVDDSFPDNMGTQTEPMLLKVIDNGETVFQELTTGDDIWRRTGTHNGTFNPWYSVA